MSKKPKPKTWEDLSDDERAEAVLMHREGLSVLEIAEKFGVEIRKEKSTKP